MPSKRPLCDKENNQNQSKKAKMVRAIQACMKIRPVVKLIDVVEEINQKKLLLYAINNRDVTHVLDLLKIKVDPNIRELENSTPLHFAAYLGHFKIAKILVNSGANLNATNFRTETPLHAAIAKGKYAISKYLLKNGAEVNPDDKKFYAPLMIAVINCRVDLVKLLLSHGALVNVDYNFAGKIETPLQVAIKDENLEITEVLLKRGADPNFVENFKYTYPAIDQAIETGNSEIIKMLLKYGAHFGIFLKQALHSSKGIAKIEMLITIGMEVEEIEDGRTPLHNAVYEDDNIELVNHLIGFGSDINAKDFTLDTPLHHAFYFRVFDFKLLKVLIQNGANPNLKNEDGESTIEKALKHKTTKYFKAILHNQCHF